MGIPVPAGGPPKPLPTASERAAARRPAVVAGLLLVAAGCVILMGIVTAEALYPAAYSTHANTVSDLGAMRPNDVVRQPSSAIFDWTMIATGVMILAAAGSLRRAVRSPLLAAATALLGVGMVGVGLLPGDRPAHQLLALLAFTAGGLAAVLSARVEKGPVRHVSAVLGAVALVSLVVGTFFMGFGPAARLGEGGVERWIAYPLVLWTVSFGTYLCTRPRPQRSAVRRTGPPVRLESAERRN